MKADELKKAAAAKALEFVQDGMILGIGTGSTANEFIKLLALAVKEGLKVTGVATSLRSEELCRQLDIPMTDLEKCPEIDLDIDGADEIGPQMALIKGGGGALLREKIVAAASSSMLVIADETKLVSTMGAFPLPIEVNKFGLGATRKAIERVAERHGLPSHISLRMIHGEPFVTDGGHLILDASFGRILEPELLSHDLFVIPGVVEHGLFIKMASNAVISMADGKIKVLES
ncbi:ribose-5-phosphate isomerase RpiA [Bartonella tamiae]|uniref:Ribose-5-phosphate isomerase A n=1 Tax=Bartonella tamiae Th239 TaxID=1094558 RepID=J1JVR9_9HYPH|nr:ribose-5-phosphate isomerase RpiA [Bartonella tamiae]EJF88655.1 ribose 5-phosphate isomerase A [Bartonella tamiae Th239]EJF95095.1 ribose 5-phosphate isomerase A [Bartonella tamiae Th307]